MNATKALACLAALLTAAWIGNALLAAAQDEQSGPRLPGARREIRAEDYPSLQAAFDALPAEGGVVLLPPGRFDISEPLTLSRGEVQVRGAGAATHIVNTNDQGQPAIVVQHPDGKQVGKDDRLWRVMLSDFRVTGGPGSGAGIVAVLVEEIFLQGLTVTHHGRDGILLDHCYEDPRVSDCLLTYNAGTGLNLLGCHDIVVAANQFEENQDAVHCFDGYNLCMTGNCLDDHLGHGVVIENTYGSVVSGNMIEECRGAALIMDRDCYGNTVSANVIAHNGRGVVFKDAHGCTISANTFTIMKKDAVLLEAGSGRIVVTGNNFSNSYVGGGVKRLEDDLAAAGMTIQGAENVAVVGNMFSSLRPKAIAAADTAGVALSGNVLVDVDSDSLAEFPRTAESANVR